jgi:hypothetical protein
MAIDRIDWHLESINEEIPEEELLERAGAHIGYYIEWAYKKGLYPKDAEKYAVEECQKVVNSEVNGVQYLIENCDTKFWDVDLDEQGLKFTQFAYVTYLENYETIVGHKYYAKKYNQEDFESVSKYLDKVYEEYLNNSQAESTIVKE